MDTDTLTLLGILATFLTAVATIIAAIIQTRNKRKHHKKPYKPIANRDAAIHFYAGNDDFTVYTINTRFPKIYVNNNLGIYDLDKIVEFSERDFLKITPQKYMVQDAEYIDLVHAFLKWLDPYMGKKLKDFYNTAPFILIEHYFYFNILRNLSLKKDPYSETKLKTLVDYKDDFLRLVSEYDERRVNRKEEKVENTIELIRSSIYNCTYGNTTDLSQDQSVRRLVPPEIIKDHTNQFLEYIADNRLSKVDLIVDNTGIELLSDIILSLHLIDCGYTQDIHIHTNVLPVFVSDTIQSDYGDDIRIISNEIKKYSKEMHKKLSRYITEGKIVIKPNMFWNMPNDFRNYYKLFKKVVGSSDLIILKGDLNFRRLIEDKNWENELKLNKVISYFKDPLLILRTIKSSSLIDISKDDKVRIRTIDKTNGTYGTILFRK